MKNACTALVVMMALFITAATSLSAAELGSWCDARPRKTKLLHRARTVKAPRHGTAYAGNEPAPAKWRQNTHRHEIANRAPLDQRFSNCSTTLATAVFYLVQQQIENHVIVPRLMSSQVGLSSVAVIVAFLVGASVFGLVGAILAVPTAAIVQVLFFELVPSAEE